MRAFTTLEISVAVAILGVLAALATQASNRSTCLAAESEAKTALQEVRAIEEAFRAENDKYVPIKAKCTAAQVKAKTCARWASKGRARFTITATATKTKFVGSATGVKGTKMAGALWRVNEKGQLTDTTRLCRKK